MNNMPAKLRREMNDKLFYGRCCLTGTGKPNHLASRFDPEKIEWHHNLIFAGKQVQEEFAILPILKRLHDDVSNPEVKDRCDWIMLNRATEDQIKKYSKVVNLQRRLDELNERYGAWSEGIYPMNPRTQAYGG